MIALLATLAFATEGFDASTPTWSSTGAETFTQDGATKLWSRLERWQDPDRTLFAAADWTDGIAWADLPFSPWIRTAFGAPEPHTSAFLLHVGPSAEVSSGTPIVFVPGAGDNGSRGFITMATHMDRESRPVFVITFAHPHDDVFRQAEIVADAIAVVKARTGAAQVDLVAHSKGGSAALVYLSNVDGADWGTTATAQAYEQVGTPYRDDVRRAVFIATPLGGIDTGYRWSANNLAGLDADAALAPVSWNTYYPDTTVVPLVNDDLTTHDFLPGNGDPFPGQRQLLARQDAPLPWECTWLGGYSTSQVDDLTTYEGGFGVYSGSDGIDAAIEAGGDFVATTRVRGVDPDVAVYLLAGSNPIMPNGDADLADLWASLGLGEDDWAALLADMTDHDVPVTADEDELDGLQRGKLLLGEGTAPSDGLVFVDSALDERPITGRGAVVVDTHVANLSHLDLLYASPITGQLLVDAANDGTDADSWMRGVGKRYTAEDTIGWVDDALADESTDTGDTGDTGTSDTDTGEYQRPCGGCDASTVPSGAFIALLAALGARRRR